MFKDSYIFFGKTVACRVIDTNKQFKLETATYDYIKKRYKTWKYLKVDTLNQIGFPDVLLLNGYQYLLIEAKLLKKKQLNSIEDDLKFEFGQLPFMKNALRLGLAYMLVVAKNNKIAFIGDELCLETFL